MVWDANYIYYFLDGVQYGAQEITSADRYDEFHKPHFILLNLAVGGVWPGYPDQYTTFPQNYYIPAARSAAPRSDRTSSLFVCVLSRIDQDHKWQQHLGGDDFARVRYQYTCGTSPIQVDSNIQVQIRFRQIDA